MRPYILALPLLMASAVSTTAAWGQTKGDVITGTVSDDFDVLAGVHVVEINKDNRVMASTTTDINGNFSFAIKDPQDRLKITYIGMKTQIVPIKGMTYHITLEEENKQLQEVVVSSVRKTKTSGLDIPQTEVSVAAQTISASEFEGMPITTIDEALQGRISGLDIVLASGNLGAGTSMRLRGVSSINGNTEPLIVVDGNVWESDYNKDFDFANATEDKFAELLQVNPEDIESISVLKDAAATAIWGSQGANGVIEIKTKRGSRGATKVTYTYRANVTYQPTGTRMMNGGEYTMYLKEAYFNPRLSDDAANIKEISYLHSDAEFSEWRMFDNNTDWVDAVTQTGLEQKHFLSLTGGGEKANFRVSAGYDNQTGSVIEQRLNRFTSRTALDYFISNRIKVTTNFNFTYTDNQKNRDIKINNTTYNLLALAYVKMPNLGIYEETADGRETDRFYLMRGDASSVFDNDQKLYSNPVALASLAKNDEKTFNIQPEFILQYDLLGTEYDEQRLKYDGKVNFSIFNKYNETFDPASLVNGTASDSDQKMNAAYSDSYKSFAITTTHTLTYMPVFANTDHSLMVMGRFQLTSGDSRSHTPSVYGMPSGNIQSATADGVIGEKFQTGASEWKSLYLTASLHYAYKGRYIVDLSYRRDGSTKFGKDNRWGNFPGVSFRWNVSDEPWMKWSDKWLSMLSIRPGWGIVGNQPSAENLYFAKYGTTYGYMGHSAIYPTNIALGSLRWEEKESYNLGLDLGLLGDKVTADINVYKQKTRDLLMLNYQIPSSSGFGTLAYKNAGDMSNVGWEFNVNTNRLMKWGKWGVDLNLTFANNKNELTKMDDTILESLNGDFDYKNGSYLTRVQLNNAFGSIYGFRYKGVYQYTEYSESEVAGVSGPNAPVVRGAEGQVVLDENGDTKPMYFAYGTSSEYKFVGGDAIYEDINHDGNINELDIVYLGSSLPKLTGGFGVKLTWGRLSWNNQFNFRYGNKIINRARMLAESMYDNNNQSKAVNWRWRVEGDLTEIPRAAYQYGYNWLGSDRFVEDGSFLRLNYSSLNYSIDPKITKRWHLSQVSFFLSGSNIFCLTKYSGADPEVNYGGYGVVTDSAKTPRARSFSAGATIQF